MLFRHRKIQNNYLLNKINPMFRLLIAADMLMVGSLGMFAPFYALFVEDFVPGADNFVIGVSVAISLISSSIVKIPLALYIDKIKGELDDYYFLVIFSIILALSNLLFLAINSVWQLLILQFFLGVFSGITYPSYMALATRHIDKNLEGTEWGIYYTFVDLSSAGLAAIGGYVAQVFGLRPLVVVMSILYLLGGMIIVPTKAYLLRPKVSSSRLNIPESS